MTSPLNAALRGRVRAWVLHAFPRETGGIDYDQPAGDPGLFDPDGATWRVHADFPGMLSGGLCALMLQTLHPAALAGVWDHSNFRADLVVRLRREKDPGLSSLFGANYAWMDLSGTVPADVLVQLVVGSGDGSIDGAAAASADVGSGDAVLRNIRGAVTAKVGSGDIEVDGAGSLNALSTGSGDIKARAIGGAVEVGSIGSGDFELDGARGDVRVGSIGSGDAELNKVGGAVRIGSVGSGGANVRGAASLSVGSIGSGGVDHSDITGAVDLPRRD